LLPTGISRISRSPLNQFGALPLAPHMSGEQLGPHVQSRSLFFPFRLPANMVRCHAFVFWMHSPFFSKGFIHQPYVRINLGSAALVVAPPSPGLNDR